MLAVIISRVPMLLLLRLRLRLKLDGMRHVYMCKHTCTLYPSSTQRYAGEGTAKAGNTGELRAENDLNQKSMH